MNDNAFDGLRGLVAAAAVFAAVFVLYSGTFGYPFHFYDKFLLDDESIRAFSNLWQPYTPGYVGRLSFALNYAIGGNDVFGYHLVNILIHAVNGVLVWLLALLLFETPALSGHQNRSMTREYCIALTAALFFVAHPVNTQAVTYISERFTSLATLFYLAAVIFYLKYAVMRGKAAGQTGRMRAYYVVAVIFAVLAAKTKEISFTLPFALLFVEIAFFPLKELRRPHKLVALAPFFLASAFIILSILKAIDTASHGSAAQTVGDIIGGMASVPAETKDISRHDYLLTQFRVVVTYLRLLIFPVNQNLDYEYPIATRFFSAPVALSALFLLFVAAFSFFAYLKSRRSGGYAGVLLFFGVAWFFVALSVESSVIPIRDVIFEHRMYLPMAGASIAVSAVFYRVFCRVLGLSTLRTVFILALIALLPYAAAAYARNGVWKDEVTLWEDVVMKSPGKVRGYNNLGVAYNGANRYEEAVGVFEGVLSVNPDMALAYNNIALAHAGLGNYSKAIGFYKEALGRDKRFFEAYANLGRLYGMLGRYSEAEFNLNEALMIKPDYSIALYGLGEIYMEQGYLLRAAKEFRAAIRLDPGDVKTRVALANVYLAMGEFGAAVEQFIALERFGYRTPDLYYNLGVAYLRMGMKKEARAEFERVLKLDPLDEGAKRMLDTVLQGP